MGRRARPLGKWLRDVIKRNPATFRLFGPDETASTRLQDVFEVTNRVFDAQILPEPSATPCLTRRTRMVRVLSSRSSPP